MDKSVIIMASIPITVMGIFFGVGFSYAGEVSDHIKSEIPNAVSCDEIKYKLNLFENNQVLGIDNRGILKELHIKGALMECGF